MVLVSLDSCTWLNVPQFWHRSYGQSPGNEELTIMVTWSRHINLCFIVLVMPLSAIISLRGKINQRYCYPYVVKLTKEKKMKRIVKLSTVLVLAGLAVGCATNSDITGLQSQINDLKGELSRVSAKADAANAAAEQAASRAAGAEAAANRAASYAEDTNTKLDRMFKKSMMK